MKSKILFWSFAFTLLFALVSCKAKESAYQAAYEKAMRKDRQNVNETTYAPVVQTSPSTEAEELAVQKEKVTIVEGSGLKRYNIVTGKFISKTNAFALKERMQDKGHKSLVVQKQKDDVYLVIIASFDNISDAISATKTLKRQLHPDYQNLWILESETN